MEHKFYLGAEPGWVVMCDLDSLFYTFLTKGSNLLSIDNNIFFCEEGYGNLTYFSKTFLGMLSFLGAFMTRFSLRKRKAWDVCRIDW